MKLKKTEMRKKAKRPPIFAKAEIIEVWGFMIVSTYIGSILITIVISKLYELLFFISIPGW